MDLTSPLEAGGAVAVALVAVGKIDAPTFQRYAQLLAEYASALEIFQITHGEKYGVLQLRYVAGAAAKPSDWDDLHAHRRVRAVVGICHCLVESDLIAAYSDFAAQLTRFECHGPPPAQCCFGFDPVLSIEDELPPHDERMILVPPGDVGTVVSHVRVVVEAQLGSDLLHALAAEAAAPPAVLSTPADTPESATSVRRLSSGGYGSSRAGASGKPTVRQAKRQADLMLLRGATQEARIAYERAIELGRAAGPDKEGVWLAASLEGLSTCELLLLRGRSGRHELDDDDELSRPWASSVAGASSPPSSDINPLLHGPQRGAQSPTGPQSPPAIPAFTLSSSADGPALLSPVGLASPPGPSSLHHAADRGGSGATSPQPERERSASLFGGRSSPPPADGDAHGETLEVCLKRQEEAAALYLRVDGRAREMLAEAAFKVARLYVHLSHHRRKKEAEAEAAMSEAEQAMAATATEVDPSPSRWRQLRHRAQQWVAFYAVQTCVAPPPLPSAGWGGGGVSGAPGSATNPSGGGAPLSATPATAAAASLAATLVGTPGSVGGLLPPAGGSLATMSGGVGVGVGGVGGVGVGGGGGGAAPLEHSVQISICRAAYQFSVELGMRRKASGYLSEMARLHAAVGDWAACHIALLQSLPLIGLAQPPLPALKPLDHEAGGAGPDAASVPAGARPFFTPAARTAATPATHAAPLIEQQQQQ